MENTELLKQALPMYLNHGVKIKGLTSIYPDPIITGILNSNNHVYWNYHGATGAWKIEDIVMYLRPLSDLTKEIEHNGEKFIPNDILNLDIEGGKGGDIRMIEEGEHLIYYVGLIEYLFEWHFDVFGLIGKGLAISYNDLK